jgi:Protein of unknown function (DUF3037)
MSEKKQYDFVVVKYVTNVLSGDAMTIGLAMCEPGTRENGFLQVRFTKDWERLLHADPDADVEVLQAWERELASRLADAPQREAFLKRMAESTSNSVQVSPVYQCLTEDPTAEFETLRKIYLPPLRKGETLQVGGRRRIRNRMNEAFVEAGVWDLMLKDIAVASYTAPGDPMKIDFGYRVGGDLKMFHAVSLKNSVDQAVLLAMKYPMLAAGITKADNLQPSLTAVMEDNLDRKRADIEYALGVMERNKVEIAYEPEIPAIAERARIELNA